MSLYKVVDGECGEVALMPQLGAAAQKISGLQVGHCKDISYSEPAGSKELDLPLAGHIELHLFKKADLLGLAASLGSALLGVEAPTGVHNPCCKACVSPQVKYYSVDTKRGHCGECCMNPAHYWGYKIFEPNLTLADGKTCADLGFLKYDETVTHGAGPITMTLDLYNPAPIAGALEEITLYKTVNGDCGQATLDKRFEGPAEAFAGLKEGLCKDFGYTEPSGSQSLTVPVLGKITIELYKKPGDLTVAEALMFSFKVLTTDTTSLYLLQNGVCSEATVDRKFKDLVALPLNLKEGTCKAQGYEVFKGSQGTHVPFVGEIILSLYYQKEAAVPDVVV